MKRVLFVGLVFVSVSCKPDYPKCDNDEDCSKGEFCINGQCQQCRSDKDCKKGEECTSGRCNAIENYCEKNADCPGGKCKNNRCVTQQCQTDKDCPENHECQNGRCIAPPPEPTAGPCTPEPVYFDFDEFVLTSEATSKLQGAAQCIKSGGTRAMRLEGHTDPRGTDEYNMALGDKRAQSVRRYLSTLGIVESRLRPVSKGEIEAKGTDEGSWSQDRRVQFIWE